MTVYRRPDPIPRRAGASPTGRSEMAVQTEQSNLSYRVARQIFSAIVDGQFPEGSILPNEQNLASELGVSRTALREAISTLASKGLLEARRRRGTMVLERDRWNALDPEIIAWSRRNRGARISAELWNAVVAVLPALVAETARQPLASRLGALAASYAARKADSGFAARRDFLIEVARLSDNRFLLCLVSMSVGSLFRDDPDFFAAASRGITPAFAMHIASLAADGNATALQRAVAEAVAERQLV